MTASMPPTTLTIVANGPGEIAGWAVPVAAEARRAAADAGWALQVALCLSPCQFASGQEERAAAASGVFDHVVAPRSTLRLALGLPGWTPPSTPVLLHVGGDFWYSRRLARRWRARAFAFVERAHVSRAHRAFERIFVPTAEIHGRLLRYGVPADKVVITGDPRFDAILSHRTADVGGQPAARPTLAFLAGSRDSVFSAVFPFWVQTAVALRARLPAARLFTVISPFVSPRVHQALVAKHRATLEAAGVEVRHGGWAHILGADLVLTIPGTNTLELAILRIPSLVVLPFSLAPQIPAEGLVEWITRVPYLGPALRLFLAREYIRRRPYVALPNMRARRLIMPELTGEISAERVAEESARLIQDEEARAAMARALETIPVEPGASRRILAAMRPAWIAA